MLPTGAGVAAALACQGCGQSIWTLFNSGVIMDKDFVLDVSSTADLHVATVDDGEGGEFRLQEVTTLFRIRSDISGFVAPPVSDDDEFTSFVPPAFEDDGVAVMVYLGDPNSLPYGKEIGLCQLRLEASDLEAVRKAVAKINWRRLPLPTNQDGFHGPYQQLRVASGDLLIEHGFTVFADDFIEAIAPLWDLLHELSFRTAKAPLATIKPILEVTAEEGKSRSFKIRVGLRNSGRHPVVLTDPRVPVEPGRSTEPRPRLSVTVNYNDIELPALPEDAPRTLLLGPHERWELELPWIAPRAGQHEVMMRWYDYDGPIDPVPDQLPFMPLPRKGPSRLGAGPYPIRGSVELDQYVEVEA